MQKFSKRMQGVLPLEELPLFFEAVDRMGKAPRKSFRIRRDLSAADQAAWTLERIREEGIPLETQLPWYSKGFFFDLSKMSPHPSLHPLIASGLGFIQEAGAMEVVPALEIQSGDLVLDLCAAPGAKATHIGEYLCDPVSGESSGWLVANEPDRERSKLLEAILARHGIGNSTVYNLEPHLLAKEFSSVFDRILVDAPCSGESLFAKRDEKRKDVTDKEVTRCALRQTAILESAYLMLATGGRIVYSTCAYSRGENEDVTAGFLAAHADLRLIREQRRWPHRDGVPGGYFAVIERIADDSMRVSLEERKTALHATVKKIGERGLVRDGTLKWSGEPDLYTTAMARGTQVRDAKWISVEVSQAEVIQFLRNLDSSALGSRKHGLEALRLTYAGRPFAAVLDGKIHYPRARLSTR